MWKTLIKILEKRACCHEWETLVKKEYSAVEPKPKWNEGRREHTVLVLVCKKCGKVHTLYV